MAARTSSRRGVERDGTTPGSGVSPHPLHFISFHFISFHKGPSRADAHARSPSGQRRGAQVTTFNAGQTAQGRSQGGAKPPRSSHLRAGRPAVLAVLARAFPSGAPLPPPAPSPRTTGRVRARAPRLLARISSSPVGRLVLCLSQRARSGARACSRPARQRSHVASYLLRGGEPRARAATRSAHVPVASSAAPPVALWPERRQAHVARELLEVTLPDVRPLVN